MSLPPHTHRPKPVRWLAALAAVGLALASRSAWTEPQPQPQTETHPPEFDISTNVQDAITCSNRLLRVHEALEFYRSRNDGQWPAKLSDLVPTYLSQSRYLLCPFAESTGKWTEWKRFLKQEVFRDPGGVTYAYEFILVPMDDLAYLGLTNATLREYKFRQGALLASRGGTTNSVPVVRCLCHAPVLNLQPDGVIYTSVGEWEDNFTRFANHTELKPEPLFAAEIQVRRQPGKPIPPRPASLPAQLIDLTPYYNAALNETWHPGDTDNDLAPLLTAPRTLRGTPFDARGVIQLRGADTLATYPAAVNDIPLNRTARTLAFLHAAAYEGEPGAQVAHYTVHYADGSRREIPVRYGHDVCDWWHDPNKPAPGDYEVAWEGANGAARRTRKTVRLFRTRWQNPSPERTIKSLDFVSALGVSAPFLIAITAED